MDEINCEEILKQAGLAEADLRINAANEKFREKERQCVELTGQLQDKIEQIQKLKQIEDQVRGDRPGRIDRVLKENRDLWIEGYDSSVTTETIYVDDPIYRQVLVEEQISPIFRHPLVQRLGHIKQLSFSQLTFPAATHTRLSHCLGAAKNAEKAAARILDKGVLYSANGIKRIELSEEEKRQLVLQAKVAGLLHDLGHGPFGHGLDQYVKAITKKGSPDKVFAINYIQKYLSNTISNCGIDVDGIVRVLSTEGSDLEGYETLINNLIDSPIDIDRMDYLVRDAHMTGLSIGAINIDALIERMIPFEGVINEEDGRITRQILLTFERSAIPYITHMLYARDSMYLNCYEHPKKVLAERMLTKAVEEFRRKNENVGIEDLMLLTDEELLRMLIKFSDKNDIARNYAYAILRNEPFQEVFSIQPNRFKAYQESKTKSESKSAQPQPPSNDILREEQEVPLKPNPKIENWELHSLNWKDQHLDQPRQWEERLAEEAELGEESWKVIITVPSEIVPTPKFDDIRILSPSGSSFDKLDRLRGYWEGVLKHIAIERYSIKVFASSDLPEAKIAKIYNAAKELFSEESSG